MLIIDRPTAASYMLNRAGEGGLRPGSFVDKLISAWLVADAGNAAALAQLWPDLGEAIRIYQFEPGDEIVRLREMAGDLA